MSGAPKFRPWPVCGWRCSPRCSTFFHLSKSCTRGHGWQRGHKGGRTPPRFSRSLHDEPQLAPHSLAPDEFGAKPSPQDAAQSSSLGLSCPVSSPQKSTRQEDFVAILRRDHHVHLERCSSSSTGAQSPHDVPRPRPRPPGSPDTQFGHLLELIECPLWVQSLELHPSQCFEALQPSTMVELAECCFRCWIRQHREGSRYRRYFELSPLYILICITHEFLSFPNIMGLMQHQS